MSMEKRRNELGKLLACLLVSRKGVCYIRDLERDYRENEGRSLPFRELGYSSSLDFLRSISNHVRLEPRAGGYVVLPVVSDKIKHVNELVSRQKATKRSSTPVRRRSGRISQYYPPVRDQKPFVHNTVQKEIARILTANPNGVNKNYIVQCLEKSDAIGGRVNINNVDEYLRGMPYTAVASGNMVYLSRSFTATTNTVTRQTAQDIDGFEIVTPASEFTDETSSKPNNNPVMDNAYPAGEEHYECDMEDEFEEEYTEHSANVGNHYPADNNYEYDQLARTDNDNKATISPADFIDQNKLRENYDRGFVEYEDGGNADYTFESDDDGSIDIINPRLKSRLQQLIKKHPEGMWCANLLQAFSEEFKVPLDYADLGYGSVCELAASLPKIFHLHRENNRKDFMLYDATKPLPPSANQPESEPTSHVWEAEYYDDDVKPFPMELPLTASQSLVPSGVLTYGESVGQERIPEIRDGSDCLEIYVVEVYSPSLFWIHLRKQRSKLSQLMEAMHKFYQQEGDNYTIPQVILEKGLNCVCTFEDKWHRAIIKTVKPDGNVTLVFYDYGTTKTYDPNCIRFLVRTYSNLPAQAICCGLYNVKPINSNVWTRGASTEFYSKVADIPLVAIVVKVDTENNSMLVSLVDTQSEVDEHINDWLVDEGLAASGFMEDTVDLECPHLEDQIVYKQEAAAIGGLDNVALVSPQSTLLESSESTLRPPPGLKKPTEPMNLAAFMYDCLHERSDTTQEMANSTFLNFSNFNLNNNPLTYLNPLYNPLVPQSEAFIQLCKQQVQMEWMAILNQFSSSNNVSMLNNSILNNSSTVSPATGMNPIIEQSRTNPFHTYQQSNGQEYSTITNSFNEATDNLTNLSINESNNFNTQSNKTLPNPSSRDTKLSGFDGQELFSSKPIEGFVTGKDKLVSPKNYESIENTFLNKTQSGISQENIGANGPKILNDEEFIAQQLHDTNPFKQHIIGDFNSKVESRTAQSIKPNFEYHSIIKPPIPPRNPNLVNNTGNFTTKHTANVTSTTTPVNNSQKNIPTTKIYYKADPVMYNPRTERTNETKGTFGNKTTELSNSVSSEIANSSQHLTSHALSENTLLGSGKTNSSQDQPNSFIQSGLDSQLNTAQTNSIPNFSTNYTQYMSPRILPSSYRPPPPPSNQDTSTEYLYKNKSPISPRFTSPVMSENSKAAIEELQSAIELNLFDKFKLVITEIPSLTKRDKTLKNSGTSEEHISSSSPSITNNDISSAKTTTESTLNCQNAAESNTSYKINLISPKFLQEPSTLSLKQELPGALYQTEVLNETSKITLSVEKMSPNLIKQESNTTLPCSVVEQKFYNLHGTAPNNSVRPASYLNSSESNNETGNYTTVQACGGLDTRPKVNPFSALPTLHSSQISVNERELTKDYDNCNLTSKDGITVDKNRLPFSNTELGNTAPQNISHSYQQQPLIMGPRFPPLYPNVGNLQHGPNFLYRMPQPDMQHPQVTQRVPLLRSNIHGFNPPAPHWPRPQFFNPAFAHAHNNASPLLQQPHPWNSYNSHIFVPKQTGHEQRTATPNSQITSKTDFGAESQSPRLSSAHILGQDNKENINTLQNKQTLTNVSELTEHATDQLAASGSPDLMSFIIPAELTKSHPNDRSNLKDCTLPKQQQQPETNTRTAKENISVYGTEKSVKKDATATEGLNSAQVLAALLTNDTDKSINRNANNISQPSVPRAVTNIFKPIDVNKQTIYLFNIENEGWACTDEIALTFTSYQNYNMIVRLLELLHVHINFKQVNRAQSPQLFAQLDSTTIRLPRMTNSKRIKGILHLTPLNSLIRMMYYLKVISVEEIISSPLQKQSPPGSRVPELVELITAYKSDDDYWVA